MTSGYGAGAGGGLSRSYSVPRSAPPYRSPSSSTPPYGPPGSGSNPPYGPPNPSSPGPTAAPYGPPAYGPPSSAPPHGPPTVPDYGRPPAAPYLPRSTRPLEPSPPPTTELVGRSHPDPPPGKPQRRGFVDRPAQTRGQGFAWLCLGSAVLVSLVLGGSAYVGFSSIDLVSADPFSIAAGSLTMAGAAVAATLVVAVMSAVALGRAKPKKVALLALITSIVLPVLLLVLGVTLGVQELWETVKTNVGSVSDLAGTILDKILERLFNSDLPPANW